MMRKRIIAYGLLILLMAGFFYWRPYLESLYLLSVEKIQDLGPDPLASLADTAQKEISAPPPLRAEKESPESFLTRAGVIKFTNTEREGNSRPILDENAELDAAAEKKARDILAMQYFDHISPEGNGPDYFVNSAGYDYIVIGENLALGNFADDRDLVTAWMESPGHRENILQPHFQEIGVAVIRGTYEGRSTWVAVQEFGTPITACSAADDSLKKTIDSNTKQVEKLADELTSEKADIKKASPRDPEYGEMVDSYNALVEKYNSLVSKTKTLIEKYNSQVIKYNACVRNF